jgi:thioredoxin reductase
LCIKCNNVAYIGVTLFSLSNIIGISMTANNNYDVIIIGGSYAGLSAAMALGRSLRKVLVIDAGLPCNRFTPHSHNFITHDGAVPAAIAQKAKADVMKYDSVFFLDDYASVGKKTETGFMIFTKTGKEFTAQKLIFAAGITDTIPDINGFADCWGKTIIHCPYCHGYEFRGKATAIFANGARGFHLASMVHNLTNKLTILTNGKPDFSEQQFAKFQNHHIEIIETKLAEVVHENGSLRHLKFSDGSSKSFDALYASLPFTQQTDIPLQLGCELNEQGYIQVNPMQETNIAGVFACGDSTSMMRSVALAISTGGVAGAIANGRLVEDKFK